MKLRNHMFFQNTDPDPDDDSTDDGGKGGDPDTEQT